jgi:serine protease AprX
MTPFFVADPSVEHPMANSFLLSSQSRRLCGVAVAGALFLAAASPAAAQHRARLSADLADHVSVGSQAIDVIVHGDPATVEAIAKRYNVPVKRHLTSGGVLHVNAGQLVALQQDDSIDHLSGDVIIRSSVDEVTLESIGADQVWAGDADRRAQNGRGVSVAVIDSGIDTRHNALKNRVLVTHDFTGGDGSDGYGHGTHVAAIIAGQGGRTSEAYQGIAPGAYLLNLRVLGDDGSGSASNVIEAIDWTIAHRRDYNVGVINLSLGAPVLQPYRDDPLCEAVERAVRAGITVVAAAGNFGKTADGKSVYGGITSPANSPYAIAVGATDTHGTAARSDDTLATFSSKGPTRYDLILKPDVAAPGVHIASAEAAGSYLSTTYPDHHVSGTGPDAVMQLSGTSMAAGVVSGAVALVLDARPVLTPRETRTVLQVTSSYMASAGLLGAGAGNIDALTAVEMVLTNGVPTATIGGETVVVSGLSTSPKGFGQVAALTGQTRRVATQTHPKSVSSDSILWGSRSILWGSNADSILWGSSSDSILWGSGSILWGSSSDSILWGSDSILWGSDSILWGSDSILWGSGSILWGSDSILWGSDSILWGSDSILWGSSTDSILWGASSASILWGSSADSILWGSSDLSF